MSKRDPFEEYRRRREIELMESRFKEKAAEQRKRIEEILATADGDPGDIEERITQEMEDFLSESTVTAERMLEHVNDDEGERVKKDQIRDEIRTFFAAIEESPEPEEASPEPAPAPAPRSQKPKPRRPDTPPPKPSVAERRPLGGAKSGPSVPVDLQAALEKIRRHRKGGGAVPGPGSGPGGDQGEAGADPGREILESFDHTYRQVSDLIQKRIGSGGAGADGEESDRETLADDAVVTQGEDPAAGGDAAPGSAPTPESGDEDEEGGSPAGVTNVFRAEPGEDRDIDDDVDAEEPPGWGLPVRPPPPGAWIVKKQKEEGDGGLAGSAGDTYLLKKLSQEVRRLNRVYVVLLEKEVVTREEVEGDGKPAPVRVDTPPDPASAESADESDDDVSVEDYDEERYRPILTSEKDFSLSSLVKDVHRLKCLRDVLVKKGVVTDKELAKAK